MKRYSPSVFLLVTLLAAPSCVLVVGAGIGVGAMYVLGEDSVELYVDADLDEVYEATRDDLGESGEVTMDDIGVREAFVAATVDDVEVEVFLTGVTESTTRIVVKARKWRETAPDLDLAQATADRIAFRVQ